VLEIEYGFCPCGGEYERRLVVVRLTADGEMVELDDVPQGACPVCGSRVYKPATLALIERTMKLHSPGPAAGAGAAS
jgi:YgiT-type zinc finger domain-containing protein